MPNLMKSAAASRHAIATALVAPAMAGAMLLLPSEASAQSVCTTLLHGTVTCLPQLPTPPAPAPGPLPAAGGIDLTASPDPLDIRLADGFATDGPVTLGTLAGADVNLLTDGVSSITSTGPALVIDSGQNLTAEVTNITTVGDGATGALLSAADNALFTSDGLIGTAGANADGVDISGRTVTVNVADVATQGPNAQGIETFSTSGPTVVTFDTVQTNGSLSDATVLRGTGDNNLSGRALTTNGTDAAAFNIENDAAACILLGNGGCDNTVRIDEITTSGFGGIGGLVTATGDTDVDVGVLRTGGDEAAGLNLSADPDACVALGVGACDTAFTVGELSTAGANAPGALVRGAGDIDADVGVLRTGGNEAVGLDLASDPTACAILGAGACDTSFSVGELTTGGAGATGVLVRAAGDTSGNVGVLRTQGDDAAGVDIASDPTACLLIGAGACDVGLVADEVSTQGDGAAAVLIDTVGNVTTDLGLIRTGGDNSTGLGILLDPAACLAIGPGSCVVRAAAEDIETGGDNSPGVEVDGGEGPINVDTGDVDTGGDNSPGIDVTGTGPITIDTGDVTTGGDTSPGIVVVGADGPVAVGCASVTTAGANSPGVAITAEGDIRLRCGAIATTGPNSDGVLIDGGSGTVDVAVGPIATSGAGSDGIDVVTGDGDQLIVAGPVNVTGQGANGISAVATGCADVSITARDDIRSVSGAGIVAASACRVSVTTLPGADVTGGVAGIDVTSGTGATVTIGGSVASASGPAIDADGASAAIVVTPTGTINGRIDLTGNADTLTNNGLLNLAGTSDFGAGADLLTNNGRVRVNGAAELNGLERFVNAGLVSLVDGAADDRLTICGDYVGTGGQLGLDVQRDLSSADRLVICGNASGSTILVPNFLGGATATVNPTGVVLVDAGSLTPGAFTLGGPTRVGFIDYSLREAGSDVLLVGLPNELALEPLLLGGIGRDFWYQSADAWSEAAAARRNGAGSGASFWAQGYGSTERRGERERAVDLFGTSRDVNLRIETDRIGAQGGVDFGAGPVFGVTGGYQRAETDFASGTEAVLDGYNVGAYALFGGPSGFYGELLAKADFFDVTLENGALFGAGALDGKSYGAEGELGWRFVWGGAAVDVGAGLAYVRTELDGLDVAGGRFEFDDAESLRGRAGLRVTGAGRSFAPFADVKVFHEFLGENDARFASGGFDLPLTDESRGTWVRGEIGFSRGDAGPGGFASLWGELGDVRGYGVRVGFRF